MMGLPIDKLVVATNENDVLDEFFRTGVYRVRKSAETWHTTSPSMDISKASNFERFIYDLFDGDAEPCASCLASRKAGGFDLSGSLAAMAMNSKSGSLRFSIRQIGACRSLNTIRQVRRTMALRSIRIPPTASRSRWSMQNRRAYDRAGNCVASQIQ
jgi:threonine synthase